MVASQDRRSTATAYRVAAVFRAAWRRLPRVADEAPAGRRPPAVVRLTVALLAATLAALATWWMPHGITLGGEPVGDIGPPLVSLRLLTAGHDPYDLALASGDLAQYPATTMLVLAPLAALPVPSWAPVFAAVTTGLLAWAMLRSGHWWRLLALLSVPYLMALHSVQWSPVFTAALLLPGLLPVAVAKPQLAVALVAAGQWRRTTLAVTALLVTVSFVVRPSWPLEWLASGVFGLYDSRIPLLVGPGFVLAAALLFLRSRRGRLLAAMVCIPQRFYYDPLLLFVIPTTWRQMLFLLTCSWGGALWCLQSGWWSPASGIQVPRVWIVVVLSLHLPALLLLAGEWWAEWRRRPAGATPITARQPGDDPPAGTAPYSRERRQSRPLSSATAVRPR